MAQETGTVLFIFLFFTVASAVLTIGGTSLPFYLFLIMQVILKDLGAQLFLSLSAIEENREVFDNVDFWYMPCNYSFVNAPAVMAKFVENQKCQLDTTVNVEVKKRPKKGNGGIKRQKARFFNMIQQLPTELQMMVCYRVCTI